MHVKIKSYKEAVHSRGSYCIEEAARSAEQIEEARVCMVEVHGVRGFPPSVNRDLRTGR